MRDDGSSHRVSRGQLAHKLPMMESQMTRKIATIATIATVALVVLGCGRSGKMHRGQQQYDVVQEGSASGVTSTINGPGETTAPATDTSADTTTNFTLPTNPNPLGNDTAGLPALAPITSTSTVAPHPLRPRVYTPPSQPQELRPEPPTDTTMSGTEATTTTPTTTTSPDAKKKKSDEDQPPPTDTTRTRGWRA
jgi:hypothetical protein